jgi:hypothetical protein
LFSKINQKIPLPEIIAGAGALLFIIQAIIFAHIQLPNLDEGAYLYKGYLFAKGIYVPFQPYGFWTNKMYLGFYIWGWVQELFKPGLLAPRYFAVFLSTLTLGGTWIVARRVSNRWLAVVAIWVLALNPTLIGIYSIANSQILVIFGLILILVLCLGQDRPSWQIVAGSMLAGIMTFTRENMVFVLPLLIIYIFWQHGRKIGLISLLSALLVVTIGHAIFWPDILKLWARWLPKSLVTLLRFPSTPGLSKSGDSLVALSSRLLSFATTLRIHFVPFVGSLFAIVLWPRKEAWKSLAHFRAAVFLAVTFFVLFMSHAWAALGNNYCIYCFTEYFSFWGIAGLLLVIISLGAMNKTPALFTKLIAIIIVVLATGFIWLSFFENIGEGLVKFPVPRMGSGRFLPGWTTLWQILRDKFRLDFLTARMITTVGFGLVCGIFIVLVIWILRRILIKTKGGNFGYVLSLSFLALGFLLTPLFAWPDSQPICTADVLGAYEKAGKQLAQIIPANSKTYLDGSIASIPLLYIPDAEILPPQINHEYSYRESTDNDALLREGYWNREIGLQWRDKSSVFIVGEEHNSEWQKFIMQNSFSEIPVSFQFPFCAKSSYLYIYVKK